MLNPKPLGMSFFTLLQRFHRVDWLLCRVELAKCIADPKCAANVACLQTCNGRPDETECQVWQSEHFVLSLLNGIRNAAVFMP